LQAERDTSALLYEGRNWKRGFVGVSYEFLKYECNQYPFVGDPFNYFVCALSKHAAVSNDDKLSA